MILRVRSAKRKHGNRLIDIKGYVFGHLKVIKVDITKSSLVNKDINMANAYWLCICDLCGCKVSIRSSYLRNGQNRMCSDCASAARIRFYQAVRELTYTIYNTSVDQQPEKKKRNKRKKKVRVPPGTQMRVFLYKHYSAHRAYEQIKPLREAGTSIKDICDLLEMTREDVLSEIKRYKEA